MKWPWWVGQECWEHSFSSVGRNQTLSKWGDFAHATDSAYWRVMGLSIFTGPYSVMIKTIFVLTVEIHSCVCVCDSPQMLGSSQLDGLVADAPCICWLRFSLGQSQGGCAHRWRYFNVHIYVHVHLSVCQQHKNHSSLGCFGLHIGVVEQNICSLKYVESGNGRRLGLWEFSCCSGSPETRQILALTKDDKQLLQPGSWSTYEKQLFTVHYAYTLYEELI